MNVDVATKIILRPYVTEKTFALVENEQKICFLVEKEATKSQIVEAVKTLYNEDAIYTNHIIPILFAKSLALSVELNLTNAFFP